MFKAIFSVSFFTIISRIFGFLRDMMQAAFLGVSPLMDAVAIALKVPSLFRKLFAEGAFNASFVPAFASIYAEEGRERSEIFAGQILTLLLTVVTGVVIISEFLMPYIVPFIAPGLLHDPERLNNTINFSRITFPFLLMISLTAFYSGILNSADRFVAAASSPAVGNISIILVLWAFSHTLQTPAYALVWGILVCGAVQLVWVFVATHRAGLRIYPVKPSLSPAVRRFLRSFGPGVLGSGVSQINLFIDIVLGSLLPAGGISYLYYADRLNLLPLSVIGTAIGTALLPVLSRQIQTNQIVHAQETINQILRYGLLLCLPATVGLMVLAEPIVQVLFERQKFNHIATIETAKVLRAFVCGLPAYILIKILTTIFFAHRDTKTTVAVGVGAILLNIALSLALMPLWAHVGLAISTAITAWINMGVLCWILLQRNWFEWGDFLERHILRLIVSAGVLGVCLWMINQYFLQGHIHIDYPWCSVFYLSCVVCFGLVFFIFIGYWLGLIKVQSLKTIRSHMK